MHNSDILITKQKHCLFIALSLQAGNHGKLIKNVLLYNLSLHGPVNADILID